ncbi:hypothetical protein ACOMD4_15725 [Streptomyces anulatus]|uniref:hypothetical protein n=1 Tax=Streptomyces TaxID=1883 RepID=UPI0036E450F2
MDDQQGTHFFFMSLYTPGHVWRRSGHFTPLPGMTRVDAFERLFTDLAAASPELEGATVLAFDIQPNTL